MRVELFSNTDIARCQNQVNQFLAECEEKRYEVQDIKFSVGAGEGGDELLYSAMVIISNASVLPDGKKKKGGVI